MKALLLSLSLIGAVVGTSFSARADEDQYYHHRYYENRARDESRSDHDWRDNYRRHHHYGYWHRQRGYWGARHHHHDVVPDVNVEVR